MLSRQVAFAAVLCLAAPLASHAQQPGEGACVVRATEGQATVSARGAGRHVAEVGLGMGRNATLRTGAEARVTLACSGELRVVIGPDTQITIARLVTGGAQPFAMRLVQGIAGFLFSGDGDGVQIHTPSAVAAVRSTEWAMQVDAGATAAFARDGAVFVVGEDGTVRLGPGDGVDVTQEGAVGPVRRWGQARIDRFAERLGPDW